MKKAYTKPTAEKLAFKYRDQVVAASNVGSGNGSDNDIGWDDVINWLFDAFGACNW